MPNTVTAIKEIIAHLRGVPSMATELGDHADLLNDVGLDSIELLQFMLEVEARTAKNIDFEKLEFSHLSSISGLAEFLETMPSRHASQS
jgi:acyl carrier protein